MARPPSGAVLERKGQGGEMLGYALRFSAYGKRRYLTLKGGTTRPQAESELQNVLADVRRGIWKPPETVELPVAATVDEPNFHAFASEWVATRRHEVDERTVEHWEWALSNHLLPFFAKYRPSEITGRFVKQFNSTKLEEGRLSASSINKCSKLLAQILEDAIEDGYLTENPARGKRRRLKAAKPARSWLKLDEVSSLIEAAGSHRALIAAMILAGLRVSELAALCWRDVDLAAGRITVSESKTDAGTGRVIDASPWLVEELVEHRMRSKFTSPTDLVFATRNRTRRQRSNISRQILAPAIEAADKKRAKEGRAPITKVTNHSLRRTFCALLYEAGATPPSVMAQMGHTDAKLALEVYAKVMERKRDTGARMDALVRGPVLAGNGSTAESVATIDNAAATKKPLFPAAS